MKLLFLVIATALGPISIIPYARDILKGITKPNIVTWITWTLLTTVATAAEISGHEYRTAIFTSAAVLETAIVVVLGLKHGFVKYTSFDVVCQVGAVVGIVLWQIFNSPALGVVAIVVIDIIGTLPTFRHSWLEPGEETWSTYTIAAVSGVFAIAALTAHNWVSLTYPVYIVLTNVTIATIIIRRNQVKTVL
jgi:hypothetical protein